MRGIWLGGALVAALALAPAPARAQESTPQSLDAAWTKAMKMNDLDGVVACYAPEAVMWLPNAPEARGTKAIRDVYAGYFDAYTVSDAALTDATYETTGDLSASCGHFALTLKPKKGGETVVLKGRYLVAMKRAGGAWQLVADHASADPEPAPR